MPLVESIRVKPHEMADSLGEQQLIMAVPDGTKQGPSELQFLLGEGWTLY